MNIPPLKYRAELDQHPRRVRSSNPHFYWELLFFSFILLALWNFIIFLIIDRLIQGYMSMDHQNFMPSLSEGFIGGSIILVIILFSGILMVFFVHYFLIRQWRIRQLFQHGIPVPGIITSKYRCDAYLSYTGHPYWFGGGGQDSFTYFEKYPSGFCYLNYKYQTLDGIDLTGCHQVDEMDFKIASEGSAVTVLYYPGRSHLSRIYEYGEYYCEKDSGSTGHGTVT